LDVRRNSLRATARWGKIVGRILKNALPLAPDVYDREAIQRILADLQLSLDSVQIPPEISGEDDVFGTSWFLS